MCEVRSLEVTRRLARNFEGLFPDHDLSKGPHTIVTLVLKTSHRQSAMTSEMMDERTKKFATLVSQMQAFKAHFDARGTWCDFIDPVSGAPFHSDSATTFIECDERYRSLGFEILELGCCRAVACKQFGQCLVMTSAFVEAPADVVQSSLSILEVLEAKAAEVAQVPSVLFVLGGPGAGKGTQCAKIVESYPNWGHVSAGDCLRAEKSDPTSKDGELINNLIKEGKIVPAEITVRLLMKAMAKGAAEEGKTSFLIDGFPRNQDNVNAWEGEVGRKAEVRGVLFYEAREDELERRLLQRGESSGRSDDNIDSIKKRFRTYVEETSPIIDLYRAQDKVFEIDGMAPIEDVWVKTQAVISML